MRNSVGNLQSKINIARQENNKRNRRFKIRINSIDGTRRSSSKITMVILAIWTNYMYDKWNGAYKGRADKSEKYAFEGVFTRSLNTFEKAVSPLSENMKV